MTALIDVYDYYGEKRPSTVFYDLMEGIYRPIGPEIAFYHEFAKNITTPILEMGCGTGRISWALAEIGHCVLGVDISEAMLERAKRKYSLYSTEVGARTAFQLGNICTIDLEQRFDLILAPYRVFDHLPTFEDQCAFLYNAKRHLSDRGLLIFDTTEPTTEWLNQNNIDFLKQAPTVVAVPHLGIQVERRIVELKTNQAARMVNIHFCYTVRPASNDSVMHVDQLALHWTPPEEIRAMLTKCGFNLMSEYKGFDRSMPHEVGDRVWVATV